MSDKKSIIKGSEIFRKDCPKQKKMMIIHDKVAKYKEQNDRLADRINRYNRSDRETVIKELRKKYVKIPAEALKVHKYVEECLSRNTAFMLKISEDDDIYNKEYDEEIPTKALFSSNLTVLAFLKFRSFIREYQLKEKPKRLNVIKLIDDYNKNNKSNLNKSSMIKFYDHWEKYTEKDLIENGFYSKATVYRFLAKFKKLGITNKCVMPSFDFNADTDLIPYSNEVRTVRRYVYLK